MKINPKHAAGRMKEFLSKPRVYHGIRQGVVSDINKLITGIDQYAEEVKLKNEDIGSLKQVITTKTVELKNKTVELKNKTVEAQNKEKLLAQKEQLLSEISIREENQLKEEYIKVLNQLNPKVFSANFEDWPVDTKAKKLLDSGNLQKIENNLVVYRELLKKESTTKLVAKDNLLNNKDQELEQLRELLAQKEIEKEELLLAKEAEVRNKSAEKNRIIEELRVQKDNDIQNKNLALDQKDVDIHNKDLALEQLRVQKEMEKEQIRVQKDVDLHNKDLALDQLRVQKEVELRDKDLVIVQKDNQIQELSFIDMGIQMGGNEIGIQIEAMEMELAGNYDPQNAPYND